MRAGVHSFEMAHHSDPLFNKVIGCLVSWNSFAAGDLKYLAQVIVDAPAHTERTLSIVAFELDEDVDHATGVNDVIWSIQNFAFPKFHAAAFCQLVVSSPRDNLEF